MKVFVTGGTGFIGSNFINYATNLGIQIVAPKRLASQTKLKIDNPARVKWINKELDEDFEDELRECDALIHLAAHSVIPPYKPLSECLYWNVFTAIKLLETAERADVRNVIIAGSCFEYGLSANDYEKIPPSAKLKPVETYGVSKALATEACIAFAKGKQMKMQVLRIFQVYGDGENESRFWPSLKKAALSGSDFPMSSGEQIRDFIHVSKVCDELLYALSDKTIKTGQPTIRNIGEGEGRTLLDFANYWWTKLEARGQLMPGSINMRQGEIMRIVADINLVDIP